MTKVANCDLVFDVLTRGPFPSGGADDVIVEQHLAACHECRQLAEALRPAVDLFHEALDPATHNLPGYTGRDEDQLARSVMTAVSHDQVEPTQLLERKWGRSSVLPLMAVVLGVTLFLALTTSPGAKEPPAGAHRDDVEVTVRYQPNAKGRDLLSSLAVGVTCLPERGAETQLNVLAYRCCTDCHAATVNKPALTDFPWSRFLRSCGACHDHLAMGTDGSADDFSTSEASTCRTHM